MNENHVTKEGVDVGCICGSCSAYHLGESICDNGFPMPYANPTPMCMRSHEDIPESVFKRYFDKSGKPLFAKTG